MSDIVGSRQSDEPTIRHRSPTVISVRQSDSFVRQFRQCPTIRAQVATSRDADVLRWCVASRRPAMVCDGPRWSAIVRARAASPRISRDIPRYSAIFRDMLRWCDVLRWMDSAINCAILRYSGIAQLCATSSDGSVCMYRSHSAQTYGISGVA